MIQETQRILVRIAVAVDRQGVWCAMGHCADESSAEAIQTALDYLSREESRQKHVVWLTAEVPLPAGQAMEVARVAAARETVPGIVESVTDSAER